eukprot:TRINITY_DN414_c0_g1_i1.p1 TRINITY_DN414_c0_g1~~TRINITY_DN414_c0_g1_i1.p1  ORF type:complete len:245 (-),score=72.94 TRINITY_DN414_c0_g1_i1:96-830(-)
MAVGYYPSGAVAPLFSFGWGSPCGQAYSSVTDLLQLVSALMSPGDSGVMHAATSREMLLNLFVNADGVSMIGTPWESAYQAPYVVRSKGGNVDGYSALVSLVPELQLGLTMLWNGGVDEFAWANSSWSVLLPAFVSALSLLQPPVPLPPNISSYVGFYVLGPYTAQVFEKQDVLYLVLPPLFTVELAYLQASDFKIYIPPGAQTCMNGELSAFSDQLVTFGLDQSGLARNISLPGLAWGAYWSR